MKTLYLITNSYPFGGITEESFLKNEIRLLAKTFDQVVLLPFFKADGELLNSINEYPKNVVIDTGLINTPRKHGSWRYLYMFHYHFLKAFLYDFPQMFKKRIRNYYFSIYNEGYALKSYLQKQIRQHNIDIVHTIFYSFWFADASIGLALLKKYHIKWISRAHGFDLYNERVAYRSSIWRDMAFNTIHKVYACSQHGYTYLKQHYPKWTHKIDVAYLGTPSPLGIAPYYPCENEIVFLSVCRLEVVKRPLLMLNCLQTLATQNPCKHIKWILVGDGSLRDEIICAINQIILDNLEVDYRGALCNADVHKLYCDENVDWLLLLSDSEGLPICIAEALSYGVPAIATDVGGVKEVVLNGLTGILLDRDINGENFVKQVQPYIDDKSKYNFLRNESKSFWEEHLNESSLKEQWVNVFNAYYNI